MNFDLTESDILKMKKHVLKNEKTYEKICKLLFEYKSPSDLEDEGLEYSMADSDFFSASKSDDWEEKKVDAALENLFKENPGLESDNTVLWDIVWILCFSHDLSEFLYYLQTQDIKDRDLMQAFHTEEDIQFLMLRKKIGLKKLKELKNEIKANRLKSSELIKHRTYLIRLLLYKMYKGQKDGCYMFYSWSLSDDFSYQLNKNFLSRMEIIAEPRIYILNQWECKISDAVKTLMDIFRYKRESLNSMEFPLCPFYSSAIELLLNLRSHEEVESTLKEIENETIKDTQIRLSIIQDGIISIREGEHPFKLLEDIGKKYRKLRKPLNEKYDHPFFEQGNDELNIGRYTEGEILELIRKTDDQMKTFTKTNFWTHPLENIVDALIQISIIARLCGLLSIESVTDNSLLKNQSKNIFDDDTLQTQTQKTFTFFRYAITLTREGVGTEQISFCLSYNASLIVENLSNHLKLVRYLFSNQVKNPEFHFRSILNYIIPEKIK